MLDKESAGFLAGVGSGVTKLVVGHPFDTIKVRMQVEGLASGRFKGPLDCLLKTVRKEGVRAVYKGAALPLFGWSSIDSVMMGTYNYVLVRFRSQRPAEETGPLPLSRHAIAGLAGGIAASFVATPIEQIKARLQVQYDAETKRYSGPIDCARKIVRSNGVLGLWQGFSATILYRHWFWAYMTTVEVMMRTLSATEVVPKTLVPFLSGGCGATAFWLCCLPFDTIKARMMAQPDTIPRKYPNVLVTARAILATEGWKGFYRGLVPTMLRSFPTNGAAIWVYSAIVGAFETPIRVIVAGEGE